MNGARGAAERSGLMVPRQPVYLVSSRELLPRQSFLRNSKCVSTVDAREVRPPKEANLCCVVAYLDVR
jgi:hypothetical protein